MATFGQWAGATANLGDSGETEVWMGFVFDISSSYSTDSERSLALEPPIFNFMELVLTRVTSTANTSGVAYVTFVPEFSPDDYASTPTSLRPTWRNEWVIGYTEDSDVFTNSASLTIPIGDKDEVITPPDSGYVNHTGPVANAVINPDDTGNLMVNFGRFQSYLQNSQSDGTFALSVYIAVVGGDVEFHSTEGTGTVPGLNATQHNFHTGVTGWPMDRRARVRHCPKSGFPGLSDEFIKDGYRQGMWVLPRSWDPEDRTNMDFHPSPTEGVVDDEIP
jgi:hypothetical protein